MMQPNKITQGVLYLVIFAAPPASSAHDFIAGALTEGWDVYTFANPQAMPMLERSLIMRFTGSPVHSEEAFIKDLTTLPPADAIVVAPATFAAINQWASGTGETLAMYVLYEGNVQATPTIVAPCIRWQLAQHPVYVRSIARLKEWNVRLLYDAEKVLPSHMVSWKEILDELRKMQQDQYQHPVIQTDFFPEEIRTVAAAERYDLTSSYVARLAREGLVRARRVGRDWVIDEVALRNYLRERRKPGPKSRALKVYRGWREVHEGVRTLSVTVNGDPLPPFNRNGPGLPPGSYEWGYYGGGPSTLAVSILADYFGEKSPQGWASRETSQAMKYFQDFKVDVVGKFPPAQWELTSEQIEDWLEKQTEDENSATENQLENAQLPEALQ
jgi:hypothetical protein